MAHFFVFYYGVLADITPPVALAAYAGASMAGADPFKTGNTAFRLALGKALVPFVFVYGPSMLLVTPQFTWPDFLMTLFGCVSGIVMLSAAFTGYALAPMRGWERWLIAFAAFPTMAPGLPSTLDGAPDRKPGYRPPGRQGAPERESGGDGASPILKSLLQRGAETSDAAQRSLHMRMNVHSHMVS